MKLLRTFGIVLGLLIPTYAIASATGSACCHGACCPSCPSCPHAG